MAARSRSSSTIKSSLFRAKADTTSNLKAYYSFDAFTTGDATVADDSGNNNDLIVGDSPTSVDAGHSGKAILSAGSNELHRNTPFNDANFTIAAWVKFSSAPGAAHRVLFETGDHNAGSGWFFYIDKDSSALSLGDVSLAGAVSSTSAAAVGPWVFAAVVYDGDQRHVLRQRFQLYLRLGQTNLAGREDIRRHRPEWGLSPGRPKWTNFGIMTEP